MTDAKKELAAEMAPRASLVPWRRNPRKNDLAVQKVADSIRAWGWGAPIVARASTRQIIAGHTRWKAAEVLGLDLVPVRFVDVDERTAELMALADNRLGEVAEWDDAQLLEILSDYGLDDAALAGWTGADLEEMGAALDPGEPKDAEPQIDKAEELRQKWGVERGQMWALGDHRILCGDSTKAADVARVMGGEKANLVTTDPPYGVSYVGKTKDALPVHNDDAAGLPALLDGSLGLALLHSHAGACWYVAAPARPLHYVFASWLHQHGIWRQTINWVKQSMVLGHSDYHYQHEPIFYGWVPGAPHKPPPDRKQTTVWEIDRPSRSEEHPTMKPVDLFARAISNSSDPGWLVYDPFSGSGTTLIACERLGRRCRAIEIDPAYVAVAIQRWVDMTGGEPRRLHGSEE